MDAAIRRHAESTNELNNISDQKQRNKLLAEGLDQTTLEYLYIQWIVECDLPFNQVTYRPFRAFLEYINSPANKMLPRSPKTIRTHAFKLFDEGKQRLRHLMATAISDIHITCDMWTSPNYLEILAVVAHFTTENLE